MDWLVQLWHGDSVAHAVLVLSLIVALGLAIGSFQVRGVGLGIAGVLFAGLAFGHFAITINHEVMDFGREFGLILFVFGIGLQVGPGFFSSLKKQGLPLNLMAASIVLLGVAMTLGVAYFAKVPFPVALGLFSGATTNTPSLAAGQQALQDMPQMGADAAKLSGLGYAVAYPFGVIGIIIAMLLARLVFRIDVERENDELMAQQAAASPPLEAVNIEVQNPNLDGVRLVNVPALEESGVVVSRIMHDNQVTVAGPQSTLQQGDVLLGVGSREGLEQLQMVVGRRSETDLRAMPGDIVSRRITVTRGTALGKSLQELGVLSDPNVTFTRVRRMELEFIALPNFHVQFGDSLLAVGTDEAIDRIAKILGNAPHKLEHPRLLPLFVGIALGVLLGSIPFPLPGVPAGVKLGLAGGPLLVALLLSRLGNVGPLVFALPKSANMLLREFGIALFLACAGLKSGSGFVNTLVEGQGVQWMGLGALITFVPLLIVGTLARAVWKVPFPTLCGLLAGSMTDPPALAFAGTLNTSQGPSLSYATVYPLVMLMRVVAVQLMVLFFAR